MGSERIRRQWRKEKKWEEKIKGKIGGKKEKSTMDIS
jgi:hypothetical protein